MDDDPIVKEIRDIGAKMAEESGYDFHKFCETIKNHEEESEKEGWKFITKEGLEEKDKQVMIKA